MNSNQEKDLKGLIEELRTELTDYLKSRIRLFKLDSFEKGGIALSLIGYGLIILVISLVILFFFLLGLAFFLGEMLESDAAGFAILLGLSILALIIVSLNAKKIKHKILIKSIEIMRRIDANETE